MAREKPTNGGRKKPTDGGEGAKPPRYPSRKNTKYAGIPREYWEALERLIADDPQYEGRSVAFLVKRAVRSFLESLGKLPKPPSPPPTS